MKMSRILGELRLRKESAFDYYGSFGLSPTVVNGLNPLSDSNNLLLNFLFRVVSNDMISLMVNGGKI